MSTLATLRSKFNTDVKINKSFQLWPQSVVDDYLNQAYYQVQKDGNFEWAENQTSAVLSFTTNEASLPADFMTLDLVKVDNSTPTMSNKIDLLKVNTDFTQTGSPAYYYLYGGNLGFDKIPNGTVTIYYKKQLADMDSTTPTNSEFPSRFDLAIVKYAAYLAFSTYLPNDPRGASRLADYEKEIQGVSNYQINDSEVTFNYSR